MEVERRLKISGSCRKGARYSMRSEGRSSRGMGWGFGTQTLTVCWVCGVTDELRIVLSI